MVIAHKSTTEDIGILRKLFQQYDTEKNGVLSFDEFKHAMATHGYSENEMQEMFDAAVSSCTVLRLCLKPFSWKCFNSRAYDDERRIWTVPEESDTLNFLPQRLKRRAPSRRIASRKPSTDLIRTTQAPLMPVI